MLPRDYDPGQDPQEYLDQLDAWETKQTELIAAQSARAADLVVAQARLDTRDAWLATLRATVQATATHADQLAQNAQRRAANAAALDQIAGTIADYRGAREGATARLLDAPGADEPLLLLPLRLETRWLDGDLHVRIFPDEIGLDRHDPSLTADETAWAAHFWQAHTGSVAADAEGTWQRLVRRFGAPRAGWLVQATRPGQPPPEERSGPWPRPPRVALLPDRFAVVTLTAGLPVNVAPVGEPPRYVTWTSPVTGPLSLSLFDTDPDDTPWWRDLAAAREAGMAVTLRFGDNRPAIDTLVVVGVRATATGDDLSNLLAGHAVTSGVSLLPPGTPTNNSSALRSGYSPDAQEQAARAVRDAALNGAPPLVPGTPGARLAGLLGLTSDSAAVLGPDATTDQDAVVAAARLVVGMGARGALRQQVGPAADQAWALLEPGGPLPIVRIGRQPYGLLPATAPGRWAPRTGELSTGLAPALHAWALATGPPVRTDPAHPPVQVGAGTARRVRGGDDSELPALLLESPCSVSWAQHADQGGTAAPTEGGPGDLVGPADGAGSAAAALAALAATAPADLAALPADTRAGSVLAQIAVAAKRSVPADRLEQLNAALLTLAAADRAALTHTVAEFLDAASHRFDAWVTAAATERGESLRATSGDGVAVGAFGWLTDLAPRTLPRSFGHVHAPSLGQAATAAVLRSGFLGERRRAWTAEIRRLEQSVLAAHGMLELQRRNPFGGAASAAARVQAAEAQVTAVTAELERARYTAQRLLPLDATVEQRLPMAIDLSSRRVRGARWVLSAVRAGQPLAAVLGYQFERDLVDAGLPHYLAAFRKLTRFDPGTALDVVEQQRETRGGELNTARAGLAERQDKVRRLVEPLTMARHAEHLAAERNQRAVDAYLDYRKVETTLDTAKATVTRLQRELDDINAAKPTPASRPFTVTLP